MFIPCAARLSQHCCHLVVPPVHISSHTYKEPDPLGFFTVCVPGGNEVSLTLVAACMRTGCPCFLRMLPSLAVAVCSVMKPLLEHMFESHGCTFQPNLCILLVKTRAALQSTTTSVIQDYCGFCTKYWMNGRYSSNHTSCPACLHW